MLLLLQIGEIASRYQLHTSLPSRSALHIRQKFQWTSEQLKSAYLDLQHFHRRSSKFPAEHPFFVVRMIYSLFYRHNSSLTVFWVSSFHLSVNTVVLYKFTVPGHIENFGSKVEVRSLSDGKKRFKSAIMFSGHRRRSREERNGFVKAYVVK